ncbi:MAG: magnesium transporter CorA family protein, partial [Clostridia bacterium]
MLQVYKKINKSIIAVDAELIVSGYNFADHWIHMSNPTDKEIELVSASTSIPEDMIKAALDEEERPRIEKEDNALLTITDIPITEEDGDHYTYSTLPFGYITTDNVVVTVCLNETSIIYDLMAGRFIKDFNIHKRTRFLLQLQYAISKKYLQYLQQIDRASQRIQSELEKSMKNKELIQMLDLEKSLVYFSTSLRSNAVVLDK